MNEKTLRTLEYPKILDRLAKHAEFSVSAEKARNLHPSSDLREAKYRQSLTTEARHILDVYKLGVGGARDVRSIVEAAGRGIYITPLEFLDIKTTLMSGRDLKRTFERIHSDCPQLAEIVSQMIVPLGLVDAITRTISDRGEILNTASDRLNTIRNEIRITHDHLLSRLQHMVNDPKITPYLQENLVTQRDGRYVIPLRVEFKGKIKAIVHDQSASGLTLFIEPLSILELNNKHRELLLEERDEEQRILSLLTEQVASHASEILQTVEKIAEIDLIFACARYANELRATEPDLKPQQPKKGSQHPGSLIRLWQARHPLLNQETVVPIDVDLEADTYILVITGPNTGGKTVSLKTIGLLILMAQSGLHIPAQNGSMLSFFRNVFADIGDEQSIEQSLSTFSGHISNIIYILKRANPRDLVILDELGAGTDPQEGAALARSILTHLLERGITTLVTTHHPELKSYAHSTFGVTNASVEFDLVSLRPTYHLTIGLPGRSNALAIAQRLGLPQEIITAARSEISPVDLHAEDLLEEIRRQRDSLRVVRTEAEISAREAESLRSELSKRLDKINLERRKILDEARQKANADLREVQMKIEQIHRQLTHNHQPIEGLTNYKEEIVELQNSLEDVAETEAPVSTLILPSGPIQIGSRVRLNSLGAEGIVINMNEEEAEIQIGMMRMKARLSLLDVCGEEQTEEYSTTPLVAAFVHTARSSGNGLLPESPGIELDLRGKQVEESLEILDKYIDAAFFAGLPFVRIIHGKGTGRLRIAVRQTLDKHPNVKSRETGRENEGGDGVTIVKFMEND